MLVARDEILTWPPSPAWALTLMPFVSLSYANLYHTIFGRFERRLNRALRGRPEEEEEEEEHQAMNPWQVGRTILQMFADDPDPELADIPIEDDGDVEVVAEIMAEVVEVVEDGQDEAEAEEEAADGDAAEGFIDVRADARADVHADVPAEDPAPPPIRDDRDDRANRPIRDRRRRNPNPNPEPANPNGANADEGMRLPFLTHLINAMSTQLLFPFVAAGIGSALHYGLPRSWVEQGWRRPSGLLQTRWGRSLAGGCVFIVLRDVLQLYTKYRRVEVKRQRKVKDLGRRSERQIETEANESIGR
jgi:hypothetical protein